MILRPSVLFLLLLPSIPWSLPIKANVETVLTSGSVEFPYAAPGRVYQVQKIWNPVTKSIEFRSNSGDIPDFQTLESLRQEDLRLEKKKYGALSKNLKMKFDSLEDNDEIQVVVHAKYPQGIKHPSKFEATQAELEAHSQSLLTLQTVVGIDELFRNHGLSTPIHIDNGSGIFTLKKSKIKELMFDDNVGSIEEFTRRHLKNSSGLESRWLRA